MTRVPWTLAGVHAVQQPLSCTQETTQADQELSGLLATRHPQFNITNDAIKFCTMHSYAKCTTLVFEPQSSKTGTYLVLRHKSCWVVHFIVESQHVKNSDAI